MLVGPAAPADNAVRDLVEPPGIAPGSGPLITSAFIAIVRANPDRTNIGALTAASKGKVQKPQAKPGWRGQSRVWFLNQVSWRLA